MTVIRWTMKLFGVAVLAGIFTLCLNTIPNQIQSDLLDRASLLLEEKSMDWVVVSADGRDITLSGIAEDRLDTEIAIATVAAIPGVRIVKNNIYTPNSEGQNDADARGFRLSLAEPMYEPYAGVSSDSPNEAPDLTLPMVSRTTSIQYDIGGRN